ncbi:mechanosensitive ion channel family protein [Spirochaeta lutea]|uniref:mechanosensitive ion channel family protein n=1 Tax=Spirochaeta lutea TaxID=1480694 RepID=UPI00068E9D9F|nr:mechanosensitive ion channel domain-containing protein [Spirochaeta lutea]
MEFLAQIMDFLKQPIRIAGVELPFSIGAFFLEFLLLSVLVFLAGVVLRRILAWALGKSRLREQTRDKTSRTARLVIRVSEWLGVLLLFARILGAEVLGFFGTLAALVNTPFISTGAMRISVLTLVALVPIGWLAVWSGKWSRYLLETRVFDRLKVKHSQRFSIGNLVRYVVMTLVVLLGLSAVGISLSGLAVLFGVLGVGLGFGLQGTVANFFSGLVIILSRPIKEGDFIKATSSDGTYEGTVTQIKLIYSVINTALNETIILPNSAIVGNSVHNYSYDDPSITLLIPIQVSYSSDIDLALEVLRDIGDACPVRKPRSETLAAIESFDDSGITLKLLVPLRRADEKYQARNTIHHQIWRRFKDQGIEIPFPQLDLHLKDHILRGITVETTSSENNKGGTST